MAGGGGFCCCLLKLKPVGFGYSCSVVQRSEDEIHKKKEHDLETRTTLKSTMILKNKEKQAGAELGQAQLKLGLDFTLIFSSV